MWSTAAQVLRTKPKIITFYLANRCFSGTFLGPPDGVELHPKVAELPSIGTTFLFRPMIYGPGWGEKLRAVACSR